MISDRTHRKTKRDLARLREDLAQQLNVNATLREWGTTQTSALVDLHRDVARAKDEPVPMRLNCPTCGLLHVDIGAFATKRHHTHACQGCGAVWRPAVVNTVGVRFLPGFRDANDVMGTAEHRGSVVASDATATAEAEGQCR